MSSKRLAHICISALGRGKAPGRCHIAAGSLIKDMTPKFEEGKDADLLASGSSMSNSSLHV